MCKILDTEPLGRAIPLLILYTAEWAQGDYPRIETPRLQCNLGRVAFALGIVTIFMYFQYRLLSHIFGDMMQIGPLLPPITPDYTRLHHTLNPDYAMSGRPAERLFVREIHS